MEPKHDTAKNPESIWAWTGDMDMRRGHDETVGLRRSRCCVKGRDRRPRPFPHRFVSVSHDLRAVCIRIRRMAL
jgi:hypothetical protein